MSRVIGPFALAFRQFAIAINSLQLGRTGDRFNSFIANERKRHQQLDIHMELPGARSKVQWLLLN